MRCAPEVGLQPFEAQAQCAARVSSCHLAQEGFQGLPLQQLHESLPLDIKLTVGPCPKLDIRKPELVINVMDVNIASGWTCVVT